MRNHVLLMALGLLLGAGVGSAALARALSCTSAPATATLELASVTVDGESAGLETAPPEATLLHSAASLESDRFLDGHRLTLGDPLTGTTVQMDYTP